MSADVEKLRDEIRHEFSYVSRYLENTGGPTLKIHLARLRALLEPAPADERPDLAADLLQRAADLLARIVQDWNPPLEETPDVEAWERDFKELTDHA